MKQHMMYRNYIGTLMLAMGMLLTGCQSGDDDEKSLKGQRISVLKHRSQLVVDKSQSKVKVQLPSPVVNTHWVGQHSAPANHVDIAKEIKVSKTVSVGDGARGELRLTSNPLVVNTMLYTIDGQGEVKARDISDGYKVVWEFMIGQDDIESDFFGIGIGFGTESKEFLGGNISYGDQTIFITTQRAKIIALNAKTGERRWARTVKLPVKTASTYFKDKLFLITAANTLFVLDAKTGDTLWTHSGLKEVTSLYGAPAPVVAEDTEGDVVVVPFSSGEIYGLDIKTGKPLWGTLLSGANSQFTSILSLSDIDAAPVVSNGIVYAVSHEGEFSAIGLRTGKTLWRQDIANTKTPWAGDKFIYTLTNSNQLVCLDAYNGAIKWVRKLRNNEKPGSIPLINDQEGDKIVWNGPVLAGGRLIIVGSHGKLAMVNPYNGAIIEVFDIEEDSFMPPIVAHKKIYVLSNEAVLTILD